MAFRSRPLLRLAPLAACALVACAAPIDGGEDTESISSGLAVRAPIGDLPVLQATQALDQSFTMPARWSSSYTVTAGGFADLMLMGDVNDDGKKDVVQFAYDGTWLGISDGTKFNGGLALAAFGSTQGWMTELDERMLVDVDGDAKDDIVGFHRNGMYVARSTGTGFLPAQLVSTDFTAAKGWSSALHRRVLVDFDRDGRKDIIGFGREGVYIALQNASGTFGPARLALVNFGEDQGWTNPIHDRMLVDLNGDGRPDIVGFGDHGVWWSFAIGIGFAQPQFVLADFGAASGWRPTLHKRLVVDYDRDGKLDVVGFGEDGVWGARYDGAGFEPTKRLHTYFAHNAGFSNAGPRAMLDLNNDGYMDIVGDRQGVLYRSLGGPSGFGPPRMMLRMIAPDSAFEQTFSARTFEDVDGDGLPDLVGARGTDMRVSLSRAVAPPPVPNGPTGARIVSTTSRAVKIAWNDNSTDERAFRVHYMPGWDPKPGPANVTSMVIDKLDAGTDYCFTLDAESVFGSSPQSTRVCGRTLPGSKLPPAIPNDWRSVCGVGPNLCPAGFHAADYRATGLCPGNEGLKTPVENETICAPNTGTFTSCGSCPAGFQRVGMMSHFETSCAMPGVPSSTNAAVCWKPVIGL
ncbi:MAG: VCBS repeat-containing protein [Labilithrix sp.]|nr:VCBS repeat-containing protein [Labilithrix sp.]